jgi:hypothetical protein
VSLLAARAMRTFGLLTVVRFFACFPGCYEAIRNKELFELAADWVVAFS